jgi:hypothetical protein
VRSSSKKKYFSLRKSREKNKNSAKFLHFSQRMSGISNGAWGLMSVMLVCATTTYVDWKSKQEEARIALKIDTMFEKNTRSLGYCT